MTKSLQRTKKALEADGWTVGITERWLPDGGSFRGGGKRHDLFGLFDLVAMNGQHLLGVQACGQDWGSHVTKILEASDVARLWLQSGGQIQLWGWRKLKRKNKDGSWSKVGYWAPRVRDFEEADLERVYADLSGRSEVDHAASPW